ncbi:MAG: glycosyltransferase family 2 protein [Muribaculaceae bacterium]|nr:glycosyltransferase family 2 protein [Muribaculaceae bacterium]
MSSLISVIIPAFNAAPFLRRSVSSALGQTYDNIEVVIVDDGSTDDTGAIADELAAQDGRIKVVHQENRGLAEARHSGIKAASAEYIVHLDADDELFPDAVAFLHDKCLENQLDWVFGSLIKVIGDDSHEVTHPMEGVLTGDEFLHFLFDRRCLIAQGEYLCRRDAWTDDIFPPRGRVLPSEDVLMNIFLSAHVNRVGLYNKPTMKYYYVPTSLSSTNRLSSLDNWEAFFGLIEENLQERGKLESLAQDLLCMKIDRLAFYVHPLDTSRRWVHEVIHDSRFKLSRRYAVLQFLLRFPKLCHWCVVNNRRLKKLLK